MASKFFSSFQVKADALKKGATRWADDAGEDHHPLSQAFMHSGTQLHKCEVSSDEDDVEPLRMRFDAMPFKPSSKVDSQSSSSVFANRPIGALLRPNNQKDVQASALKSSTFSVRPKASEATFFFFYEAKN
uniref:Uncharacterized protein n=1 Tax=Physcomitrium patens TaxID=3218 RepID=A0A2K1JDR6_PHYPA|nr:hypothetical protein PHYPA_019950 [Physcomitrium patens]